MLAIQTIRDLDVFSFIAFLCHEIYFRIPELTYINLIIVNAKVIVNHVLHDFVNVRSRKTAQHIAQANIFKKEFR